MFSLCVIEFITFCIFMRRLKFLFNQFNCVSQYLQLSNIRHRKGKAYRRLHIKDQRNPRLIVMVSLLFTRNIKSSWWMNVVGKVLKYCDIILKVSKFDLNTCLTIIAVNFDIYYYACHIISSRRSILYSLKSEEKFFLVLQWWIKNAHSCRKKRASIDEACSIFN